VDSFRAAPQHPLGSTILKGRKAKAEMPILYGRLVASYTPALAVGVVPNHKVRKAKAEMPILYGRAATIPRVV